MGEFAKLFKTKRKELNISQAEMAERLHVTKQAVSKWENAKAYPDVSLMPQIAEMFDMSVDELLTGNKPEEKVVIKEVEKEVIKEVTKPMPFRKILAIVAPIVLVIVLASALMGVYIPKALEKPPVEIEVPVYPEPTPPEIVYTDVYIKGKGNSDDSTFQAPLIDGKVYYDLKLQLSSNYTLYITAPKGAVATLNGEVIAEFDTAKTVAHSRYFAVQKYVLNKYYEEDPKYRQQYVSDYGSGDYKLQIDMTGCSEEDRVAENQKIVVRQHIGFENVTVPAGGTYFVALPMLECDESRAHHFVILSSGVRFVETCFLAEKYQYRYKPNSSTHLGYTKPTSDFYFMNSSKFAYSVENCDWQIGLMNDTDEDVVLEIMEKPIEEITLGKEISITGNGVFGYRQIFKLKIDRPITLMCEFLIPDFLFSSSSIAYFHNNCSYWYDNWWWTDSYRSGWDGLKTTDTVIPTEEIYILVNANNDVTFSIHDWDAYHAYHFA